MPSNNVTRKWRKIEEIWSVDDKYTLGTHMRYVYAFSNIIKYSESVGSTTRHSKLNLGVHQVTSFLHFPRKKAGWHKVPSPFQNRDPREFKQKKAFSYTQDHEIRMGPHLPQRKLPYATRLVCKWLAIENQFIRTDNLNRSSQLWRICLAWKVEKLSS